MEKLKEWCRYWTGYPRAPYVSRVIEFESEEQLHEVLTEGKPLLLCLTLPGFPDVKPVTEEFHRASALYHNRAHFVLVNCAGKGLEFCQQRSPKVFPWIEMFHMRTDPVTGEADVDIQVFRYHRSVYGFTEFLKQKKGLRPDQTA